MRTAFGFIGRLLVVAIVVAGVVAIGYGWKHSPAANLVADHPRDSDSLGSSSFGPQRDGPGGRGNHGLSLGNLSDLGQTLFIEAAIVGGVVLIDRQRRSRRRPTDAAR